MGLRQQLERILGTEPEPEPAPPEPGRGVLLPRTNPTSDRDLARMADHLGVALDGLPSDWLPVLRDAERVCACCRTVARCHAWLDGDRDRDSPRLFCPNAETFDELAAAQNRDGD